MMAPRLMVTCTAMVVALVAAHPAPAQASGELKCSAHVILRGFAVQEAKARGLALDEHAPCQSMRHFHGQPAFATMPRTVTHASGIQLHATLLAGFLKRRSHREVPRVMVLPTQGQLDALLDKVASHWVVAAWGPKTECQLSHTRTESEVICYAPGDTPQHIAWTMTIRLHRNRLLSLDKIFKSDRIQRASVILGGDNVQPWRDTIAARGHDAFFRALGASSSRYRMTFKAHDLVTFQGTGAFEGNDHLSIALRTRPHRVLYDLPLELIDARDAVWRAIQDHPQAQAFFGDRDKRLFKKPADARAQAYARLKSQQRPVRRLRLDDKTFEATLTVGRSSKTFPIRLTTEGWRLDASREAPPPEEEEVTWTEPVRTPPPAAPPEPAAEAQPEPESGWLTLLAAAPALALLALLLGLRMLMLGTRD